MKDSLKLGVVFASVIISYFAVVFWLAYRGAQYVDSLPVFVRLAMLAYFVLSIVVLSLAVKRFRRPREASPTGKLMVSKEKRGKRSLKSLLFIYLVAVPLCVVFAISQKEVPVKIALAGLIVPVLMIGVLWKLVVRPSINTGAGPTE